MNSIFKLFCAIIIICNSVFAQAPYGVKEQYDFLDVGHHIIPTNYLDPTIPYDCDNGLSARLGEKVADVMSSYLKMYKTTKDKAYLVKFINLCVEVQSLKMGNNLSNNPPVDAPIWATSDCMYENGRILAPMAEFVHLVKVDDPILQTIPFPVSLINNANFTTYLDFADWLKDKVAETLNYMIDYYWIDDSKAFSKSLVDHNHLDEARANEINQQSAFGVTLFYIGHAYPNSFNTAPYDYLHKADAMIQLYKTNINIDDNCDHFTYQYPLLRTTSFNAYWWFNSGWRITTHPPCASTTFPFYFTGQSDYLGYTQFREDISHAISTLFFPRVVYDYNFSSSITNDDMTRWRNTFTKNIYDGSGNFHNSVEGTDNDIDPDVGSQINDLRLRALGWMPFYRFDAYDSDPNPLYDIVMNYYANGIPGDATTSTLNYPVQNVFEGLDFLGLAEVVTAQWDRECTNLKLYNRDVTYDQDFVVKNKLVVAPQQTTDANYTTQTFADPHTFIDLGSTNRFIIEQGTTVNMVAGESIELLPGFEAKSGSNFSASISPSVCTDGKSLANNGSNNHSGKNPLPLNKLDEDSLASQAFINKHQEQFIKQSAQIQDNNLLNKLTIAPNPVNNNIVIAPNPNDGTFQISVTKNNKVIGVKEVKVYDMMGKVIWENKIVPGNIFNVDISNYSKGIYYVRVVDEQGETEMKKLVKQ